MNVTLPQYIEQCERGLPFLLHSRFNSVLDHYASECLHGMKRRFRLKARKFYGIGTKDEKINVK